MVTRSLIAFVFVILCRWSVAEDWPTYLHDNDRSGTTSEELTFPLRLAWTRSIDPAPSPAWPPPAQQDFWHGKETLKARVTFDRAFHLISDGEAIFFGSSADDQVYCLDAATGELRWRFCTEGPVRLAPSVSSGNVVFGSDDGFVYSVDRLNGTLQWKSRPPELPDRRAPGNGRMISRWPIRTGILVEKNTGYFAAGLFPNEGVHYCSVDLRDGRMVDSTLLTASAQGYLEQRNGKLFLPTGRDPRGKIVESTFHNPPAQTGGSKVEKPAAVAMLKAGGTLFTGTQGKVIASNPQGKEVWSAFTDGIPYSLIASGGRLYASTDSGKIYCFAPSQKTQEEPKEWTSLRKDDDVAYLLTDEEFELLGGRSSKGYCLVTGAGNPGLVETLVRNTSMRVICAESDRAKAAAIRRRLVESGVYGKAVVHLPAHGQLPYGEELFNIIISTATTGNEAARRLLVPGRGVLLSVVKGALKLIYRRPPLESAGEWTHLYANTGNTACSSDALVAGEMELQWFGAPVPRNMLDRHHRGPPPLFKDGLLFIPGNNRVFGVDAYNGTVLWEKPVPGSRRIAVFRDCGPMAAAHAALFIAAGKSCFELAATSGRTKQVLEVPSAGGDEERDWGYVAVAGDLLVGSTTRPGASRNDHSRKAIDSVYYDGQPPVCSDALFAIDRSNGRVVWTYRESDRGVIVNPTITIDGGNVFFLESSSADTKEIATGQVPYSEIIGEAGANIVSLELASGQPKWEKTCSFDRSTQNAFVISVNDSVFVVYSRNSEKTVWFDVIAMDAGTGTQRWKQEYDTGRPVGGSHGEQDRHPVIVGEKLIVEPAVFDVANGNRLENMVVSRPGGGCGAMSASLNALFFRASHPTQFNLGDQTTGTITQVSRPGCWINMIPAGGLLMIPEASSGCTCNYALQCSMAFRARR
jgi:outer membrane protein assembly factor BamB